MKAAENKLWYAKEQNNITRVIYDVNRGIPVSIICNDGKHFILLSVESLAEDKIDALRNVFNSDGFILLASSRADYLGLKRDKDCSHIRVYDKLQFKDIMGLSCGLEQSAFLPKNYESGPKTDDVVMRLVKLSNLLPAALVFDVSDVPDVAIKKIYEDNGIITVSEDAITAYQALRESDLDEICRVPIPLRGAEDSEMAVFRSKTGDIDHYAIIIGDGKWDVPVIRIHSACYTGDLLGSLRCDCRDQLHFAIKRIAKMGGGVLVYLMQDGRGIGTVNKIRTYYAQMKYDLDTVDANRVLGFRDDERVFFAAKEILSKLGIEVCRLLTNNPNKVSALRELGIDVKEVIPHMTDCSVHSKKYMETKFVRLGHIKERKITTDNSEMLRERMLYMVSTTT